MFGHDSNAQRIYENELNTLKTIGDNDHLIIVRGTYTDKRYLVMLLEPVADGNLKQFMDSARGLSSERQTQFRTFFGCLAHTIFSLHNMEILHKDIKPENILLKDWHLVLTDFGTAFDWSKSGQSMTRSNASDARTPRYQSPEVANAGEFHRASDIWSLGVVFLEMVTILRGQTLADLNNFLSSHGTCLTAIHNNREAAMDWCETLRTIQSGAVMDNEPLEWVKRMLTVNQFDRPSASEVCDDTSSSGDGKFCGNCCLDEDLDSEFDLSSHADSSSTIRPSQGPDPGVRTVTINHNPRRSLPIQSLPGSFPSETDKEEVDDELTTTIVPVQSSPQTNNIRMSPTALEGQFLRATEYNWKDQSTERKLRKTHSSGPSRGVPLSGRKDTPSRHTGTSSTGPSNLPNKPPQPRENLATKPRPFLERETFIRWLAAVPEKLLLYPMRGRPKMTSITSHRDAVLPTVEAQRINHFLSSLPEEVAEYEDALANDGLTDKLLVRSSTMLDLVHRQLEHSRSQEILSTSS